MKIFLSKIYFCVFVLIIMDSIETKGLRGNDGIVGRGYRVTIVPGAQCISGIDGEAVTDDN